MDKINALRMIRVGRSDRDVCQFKNAHNTKYNHVVSCSATLYDHIIGITCLIGQSGHI